MWIFNSLAHFFVIAWLLIGLPVSVYAIHKAFNLNSKDRVTVTLLIALMVLGMATLPGIRGAETYTVGFQGVSIGLPTGAYTWYNNSRREVSLDGLELAYDMSTRVTGLNIIQDFSAHSNHGEMYSGNVYQRISSTVQPSNQDAYTYEALPGTNYNTGSIDVRDETGNRRYGWVEFDLSAIPSDSIIWDAQLDLYYYGLLGCLPGPSCPPPSATIYFYRADTSWDETTITWTSQPGTAGSIINSNNFDPGGGPQWVTANITDEAQNWVDGTWSNDGLRIHTLRGGLSQLWMGFRSSEYGTANQRPRLRLIYDQAEPSDNPIVLANSTYGNARNLDALDDYIESGLDLGPDAFSIVVAVNPDTLASADSVRSILEKRNGDNEWRLSVNPSGQVQFVTWDTSNNGWTASSSATISAGSDALIGLTWDGWAATFWIDGSEDTTTNRTNGPIANVISTNTIRVGTDTLDVDRYWDGLIDEILIFDEVKTDLEMEFLTTASYTATIDDPPPGAAVGSETWQAIVGWGAVAMTLLFAGLIVWMTLAGVGRLWRR